MKTNHILNFKTDEFCISDPAHVRQLAVALGVPDLLRRADPDDQPGMYFVPYPYHATHWILLCSFTGMPEFENNALTVIGYSKRSYPPEIIELMIQHFTQGNPCYISGPKKLSP